MRRIVVAVIALLTVTAGPGARAEGPEDLLPYELASFTYWTQSPARDMQDPSIGRYNFEAGFYGAARRTIVRAPGHAEDDPARIMQAILDSVAHNRPAPPYSAVGDAGHPDLMPDYDHDGVFGDAGGFQMGAVGDFDADTDDALDTAYFRIPCLDASDGYVIHHRTTSGACDLTDTGPYMLGVARELKVINARGITLDATLWIPPEAFLPGACPSPDLDVYHSREAWDACVSPASFVATTFPAVVFHNGLSSRQQHYQWFAERMAGAGYVVLTYDPAGQGDSEGTFGDLFCCGGPNDRFGGSIRDSQDVMRWFFGQSVGDVRAEAQKAGFRLVRADPAANVANPAAPIVSFDQVSIAGNSMGAIASLAYLNSLASGAGLDGRPLPPVVAAVSMSGATPTKAIVPIQFQTSDYDGSPTLVGPSVAGFNLGAQGEGIGYERIKERYDVVRADPEANPVMLAVMEGGTHTDHVSQPFVPKTLWANSLAGDLAQTWLDCIVKAEGGACAAAIAARPHLSRSFASEFDLGPSHPSRCITVPDQMSLNHRPEVIAGGPTYDCMP